MNLMSRRHPLIDTRGLSNSHDMYSVISAALSFPDVTNTTLGGDIDLRVEGFICGVLFVCGMYRNHNNHLPEPNDDDIVNGGGEMDRTLAFARIPVCGRCKRHAPHLPCPEQG